MCSRAFCHALLPSDNPILFYRCLSCAFLMWPSYSFSFPYHDPHPQLLTQIAQHSSISSCCGLTSYTGLCQSPAALLDPLPVLTSSFLTSCSRYHPPLPLPDLQNPSPHSNPPNRSVIPSRGSPEPPHNLARIVLPRWGAGQSEGHGVGTAFPGLPLVRPSALWETVWAMCLKWATQERGKW